MERYRRHSFCCGECWFYLLADDSCSRLWSVFVSDTSTVAEEVVDSGSSLAGIDWSVLAGVKSRSSGAVLRYNAIRPSSDFSLSSTVPKIIDWMMPSQFSDFPQAWLCMEFY